MKKTKKKECLQGKSEKKKEEKFEFPCHCFPYTYPLSFFHLMLNVYQATKSDFTIFQRKRKNKYFPEDT